MVQTEKGGSTSDPGNPGHMTDKCSVTLAVCHTVAVWHTVAHRAT